MCGISADTYRLYMIKTIYWFVGYSSCTSAEAREKFTVKQYLSFVMFLIYSNIYIFIFPLFQFQSHSHTDTGFPHYQCTPLMRKMTYLYYRCLNAMIYFVPTVER